MIKFPYFLGIDLGSSGAKIAIVQKNKELIYFDEMKYSNGLEYTNDWVECCVSLINKIPKYISEKIISCSVDGTSGTLMACNSQGKPLGKAIPFNSIPYDRNTLIKTFSSEERELFEQRSSIPRALFLLSKYGEKILLRHQSDWLNGWLMNNWFYGEESNNLRLGWDAINKKWPKYIETKIQKESLPKIIESGQRLGEINSNKAKYLGLNKGTIIIAGTTDSNAAFIASGAELCEGVTVLGSTIVLKRLSDFPLRNLGISNHRIHNKWLVGGASNAGCKVLSNFFTDQELKELSQQINPNKGTGLEMVPLPSIGERFPIYDPNLQPILEPRPISDSLFLHSLLEGFAEIEYQGWEKFRSLGLQLPEKIITLGGGAKNNQWKKIREKKLGIPIINSNKPPAYGAALIAMNIQQTT